jgi:hypothetical protein
MQINSMMRHYYLTLIRTNTMKKKRTQKTSAVEDVGKLEPSCSVGEDLKRYHCY